MPDTIHLKAISVETLAHFYDTVHYVSRTPSPWAVILVKFSDDPDTNPDRTIYEKLFTTAGTGTDNMLAFFRDMSHGRLDLSGSEVFGWYRLAWRRSDYIGNTSPVPAGKIDRGGLLNATRAAATAAGVDLSRFSGVVASAFGQTDLCGWVGGMAALCDQLSLQPSLLGQEMGHGYGLDHARLNGSDQDYQDPWDVMSTAAAMEEWNTDYTDIGPGLNAQCMRSRGWLDESRVWSSSSDAFDATITLRPLHWPELSGNLAAQLGPFLVELRVPERWDAAIGQAVVLVHRFADNHSYLMPGVTGEEALAQGGVFKFGREDWPYGYFYQIDVTDIDPRAHTATLHLQARPPVPWQTVGDRLRYVGDDVGPGYGIGLVGGKIVRVHPPGPVRDLVAQVARLADTELTGDIALALASRRAILSGIIDTARRLIGENDLISGSPPNVKPRRRRPSAD